MHHLDNSNQREPKPNNDRLHPSLPYPRTVGKDEPQENI